MFIFKIPYIFFYSIVALVVAHFLSRIRFITQYAMRCNLNAKSAK